MLIVIKFYYIVKAKMGRQLPMTSPNPYQSTCQVALTMHALDLLASILQSLLQSVSWKGSNSSTTCWRVNVGTKPSQAQESEGGNVAKQA